MNRARVGVPGQSYFDQFTREMGTAATLGLGPYAAALSGPIINTAQAAFGDAEFDPIGAYRRRIDEIQGQRRAFQEANPKAALGAQVMGGLAIAPNVIQGTTALARNVLPHATPRVVTNTLGVTSGGALEGGMIGALEAKPGERMEGLTTGAATGALVATVAPALLFASGKTARAILNRLTRNKPLNAGERKLLERIQADGMTPDQVQRRLERLGPEATIADAAGDSTRGLAEDLSQQPGRTRNLARGRLERRQTGQSRRLMEAAQQGLGAEGDFYGELDRLNTIKRRDAAPLYEEAFSIQPVWSERLQQLVDDPIMRRGMGKGLEIQRLEALADGVTFNPLDYAFTGRFDADNLPIIEGVPNMRLLDAAKRGLDEIINEARDTATGKINWTQRLRAIDKVRQRLVQELDDLTGGVDGPYARARAAWAGPSQAEDAMWLGRRFMRGDPDVTARNVQEMPEGLREYFREGVFQEIQHRLGSSSETRNQTLKFLRTPNVRKALKAAFPDTRSYREFMKQAMRENIFSETRNVVRANSATARRLAGQDDLGIDPGVAVDVAMGNTGQAAAATVRKALRTMKNMPQAQKDRLGEMLLSQDPAQQQAALQRLGQHYQMGQMSQQAWEAIRNVAAGEAALVGARDPKGVMDWARGFLSGFLE